MEFAAKLVSATNKGALDGDAGFWALQLLTEATFLFVAVMGVGMIFHRRCGNSRQPISGGITMAVAAWFIVTQGFEHGPEPTYALAFGFAFAAYTLFVVSKAERKATRAAPSH